MLNGNADECITKIQADVVGKALDAWINFLVDPSWHSSDLGKQGGHPQLTFSISNGSITRAHFGNLADDQFP